MSVIFFILFILLNYLLIFKFAEQLKNKGITIGLIILYFVLLGIALAVHTWFLDKQIFSAATRSIIFRSYLSIMISIALSFVNRIFPALTSYIINFHRKYNTANINRQPIKFLIENQQNIITVSSCLILAGAVLAMYGVWFNVKQ